MLSKSRISFIKSLHSKKHRSLENLFIAEGHKIVSELISSAFQTEAIYVLEHAFDGIARLAATAGKNIEIQRVSAGELEKISMLQNPADMLALVRSPGLLNPYPETVQPLYPVLVCDDIQDPGNLGTVLRIADWFGFPHVVLSEGCVEWQNPKVIQASTGSFMRVNVEVRALEDFFRKNQKPVYGALMEGKAIQHVDFDSECVLLMGNEGHGISEPLSKFITQAVTIPRIGRAESLNVGVAAGIICAEMRRNFAL